jgi:mRNA interferase RelE/StbE
LNNWKRKLTWSIECDDRARKELRKLDPYIQKEILTYLRTHIAGSENPRIFGEALSENKVGLWRYRVRDYHLICRLEDHNLIVLVIGIGHRKEVYED